MNARIGLGNDLHRLQAGDGLWLGGVLIPCPFSSVAHSDGDVLLHAVTDAILGALGRDDIGQLFPDTADENKGRASADFVKEAVRLMRKDGYRIGNLDAVIQLQAPKFSPHKKEVRENLAHLLGCYGKDVNIKAKTGEKLPPIGTSEAVAADVVVLLIPDASIQNGSDADESVRILP